ncbi:MAG: iron-containing alcohol dehydrogenase [Alphaproteobacteria bacterium]
MGSSGIFTYPGIERVVYGEPAAEAVRREAERLDAGRVFCLVSGTLDRTTDEIARLRAALGGRFAGQFDRMPPHTPRDAVIAAAGAARAAGADLLVTFGGGSLTDAGKMVQICLRHDIRRADDLEPFHQRLDADGRPSFPTFAPPLVRQIAVPTTLSGGEFNANAGCTNPVSKIKEMYRNPLLVPKVVILDPAVTVHTPGWLWSATGIRAVDHCIETLCSIRPTPFSDAHALESLRLLAAGLPRVHADPADVEARMNCLLGAWLAMTGIAAGVPLGASHGIGHQLGSTCGVQHGHTSCILMPRVMRFNASAVPGPLARVSAALGRPGESAADLVAALIRRLDMPTTLGAVGVGREQFPRVVEAALQDRWVHSNPRPFKGRDDILAILDAAA